MGGHRPTEYELLDRCIDVHGHGHFKLVDLELQPFAEGFEWGGHDGWMVVAEAEKVGVLGEGMAIEISSCSLKVQVVVGK